LDQFCNHREIPNNLTDQNLRTDLEFVGKFHERCAGLRWVIEFTYISNSEWSFKGIPIEQFNVREEDTRQIMGYAQGLHMEYPEAEIHLFVIYCIGNQNFRVFELNT